MKPNTDGPSVSATQRPRAPTIIIDTAISDWSPPANGLHKAFAYEDSLLLAASHDIKGKRPLSPSPLLTPGTAYGTLHPASPVHSKCSSISTSSPVFSPAGSTIGSAAPSRRTSFSTTISHCPPPRSLFEPEQDHTFGPFAFSPNTLSEIVSCKSLTEVEAIGGLTQLASGLKTDLSGGLGAGESSLVEQYGVTSSEHIPCELSEARRTVFGENSTPDRKAKTFLDLVLVALSDKVIILLSVVASISLVVGLYESLFTYHAPGEARLEWVDSVSIMIAVVIVAGVGAMNDYQKEKQFIKLQKKKENHLVRVTRYGKPMQISVFEVLAGDVLHLEPGDIVPADGILIAGHGVQCDESSLTGESDQIHKLPTSEALAKLRAGDDPDSLDPFIISGSKVLEGLGTYLVTGVGIHSTFGRIKMGTEEEDEATPLQEKLSTVADQIAMAAIAVSTVLFALLAAKVAVRSWYTEGITSMMVFQALLQSFTLAITIVVAAVPEGLPLAVTLALAIAVTRLLKENNLVRILASCETMGNATTICCDKTGTLTTNKMQVVSGFIGANGSFSDNDRSDPKTASIGAFCTSMTPTMRDLVKQSVVVNSTAFEGEEDGLLTFIGSKTEGATLSFAKTWLGLRPVQEERANADVVQVYPFSSRTKCMATVVRLPNDTFRMYLKGAPEIVLNFCNRIAPSASSAFSTVDGTPLTADIKSSVTRAVSNQASQSLRTLGFTYRDLPSWPPVGYSSDEQVPIEVIATDMILLGILGIKDPLRAGVSEAVGKCQGAGVMVRMVTGDNIETAQAIAKECGILTDGGIVIDGPTFRKMPDAELNHILPRLQVLARSSPTDKRDLVRRLKDLGETVAVTGDGTNDGPALKAADVGFSMGICGTEVAKDASSIVLMDDNFASIVKATEWGRCVNDAIRKFLNFQLTVNITAVSLTFISALASESDTAILSPVQLLWVNLIMDTLAALALATDPPSSDILDRAPQRKSAPLISATSWKLIIGQSIYQLGVIGLLNFGVLQLIGFPEFNLPTLMFNTFVWMQLFNLYNNRRLDNKLNIFEGVFKNPFLIGVNVVIVLGQILIVTYGGAAMQVSPLSALEWATSLLLGVLCMPVAVLVRLIPDQWVFGWFNFSSSKETFEPEVEVSRSNGESRWANTVQHIREDLTMLRQPRSSRLERLQADVSEQAKKMFAGREESTEGERTPLLIDSASSIENRSRGSSFCASPVVMAGMVAGGVGGWPEQAKNQESRLVV